LSDAELDEKLDAKLKELGLHVTERRGSARWGNYFPHLTAEVLQRGTLQEIEAQQGKNRTVPQNNKVAIHLRRPPILLIALNFDRVRQR